MDTGQYKEAESLLGTWLDAHRDDAGATFLLAYDMMFQENIKGAVAEFDVLLAAAPNNPNYLLGKAKALVRGNSFTPAVPILDRLRTLAPNTPVVYQLEIEALTKLGNQPDKLAAIEQEAANKFRSMQWPGAGQPTTPTQPVVTPTQPPTPTQPTTPTPSTTTPDTTTPNTGTGSGTPGRVTTPGTGETGTITTGPISPGGAGGGAAGNLPGSPITAAPGTAAGPYPLVFQVGGSYDWLTNGYANWNSQYVAASQGLAPRRSIYGAIEHTYEYSQNDIGLIGGLNFPIDRNWNGRVELSGSPTHKILPYVSVLGEVGRGFGQGWDFEVGEQHSEYDSGRTDLQYLTLGKTFDRLRLADTVSVGEASGGATAIADGVQASLGYNQRDAVGIGATIGRTEVNIGGPVGNFPVQRLITANTTDVDLDGINWLLPRWAVVWGFGYHKLGNFFIRREVSLALRHPLF